MDPNTALETAKEGAKAFTKLGDIVEKFLGPKWTRKQADADKYANDKKLELIRENPDMEIIFVNGEMSAREKTLMELEQRADQRLLAEKIRQEVNLEKVLDIAAKDLEFDNTEIAEDNNVDDDWIVRLFNIVKDVSNEDMQLLWGKILAGEIKQPGSFSLRTLETLRNISTEEAKIFQKILPYGINISSETVIICSDSEIMDTTGVTFDDLLTLEEAGLLKAMSLSTKFLRKASAAITMYTRDYLIVRRPINNYEGEFRISNYQFSKSGIELHNLINATSNFDYIKTITRHLNKIYEGKYNFTLHKIQFIEGNKISFYDELMDLY